MTIAEGILSFFIYGFLGWSAEVAFAAVKHRTFVNRGFLNGPICPIYGFGMISVVAVLYEYRENLLQLYLFSVVVATFLEWMTGFLLEKLFHHRWWDYSNMPWNIQGYICLPFSLAWGVACVIAVRYLYPSTLQLIRFFPNIWNQLLILGLCAVLFADIYVTVHEIFKLNIRLKKMQEVADEIETVSVHLGENLSRNVINTMEKQELLKQKVEERYQEHFKNLSYTDKRLLQAFPKMQSLQYKKQLQMLREQLEKKRQGKK